MSTNTVSSNDQVARAIREHHARLVSDVQSHVDLLAADVAAGRDHAPSARAVLAVLEGQILPHAAAEEQTNYPLASRREELRVLVEAIVGEHRHLQAAIAELGYAADGVTTVTRAQAISTVFRLHAAKENDFILPALASDPAVDLGAVLAGMHSLLEEAAPAGHVADGVLDVRPLPAAGRHQLIFSTFDALAPGQSFELVNDHDPKPLRYQLSAEQPDRFSWDYLEAGPTAWRIRIARTAS